MPANIGGISADIVASWPPPNYENPETRDWFPIYAGILYGVTTVVTGARLWLRAYKKQAGGFGIDDVNPSLPFFVQKSTLLTGAGTSICRLDRLYGIRRHHDLGDPSILPQPTHMGRAISEIREDCAVGLDWFIHISLHQLLRKDISPALLPPTR